MSNQSKSPILLEDFLRYNYLSALSASPSGKKIAFVLSRCAADREGYESCIWLLDPETGAQRQLTTFGRERSFLWEDEDTLLFPSLRDPADLAAKAKGAPLTVFYRLNLNGGEAVRAFEIGMDCAVKGRLKDGSHSSCRISGEESTSVKCVCFSAMRIISQ